MDEARRKAIFAASTAFAAFAFFAATSPVSDGDSFWIATAGRDTLRTGHVPTTNLWSFVDGDEPWVMHEWLFGPLYAKGLAALGPSFFALVALGFVVATAAFVLRATVLATGTRGDGRDGASGSPLAGAALAVVAVFCFGKRLLTSRPSGLSLLFAMGMLSLVTAEEFTLAHAAGAVLLEGIWANAHGSFPLGVVLLLFGAFWTPRPRGERLRVVGTAGGATLATLVNPYGLGLHRLVLAYFGGRRAGSDIFEFIHSHIEEFRPLWRAGSVIGEPEIVGLAVMGGLTVAAVFHAKWRWRGVFCAGLFALAVLHARHVEQFGLLSILVLAPFAGEIVIRVRKRVRAQLGRATPPSEAPSDADAPSDDAPWPSRRVLALALAPAIVIGVIGHVVVRRDRRPEDWLAASLGGPDLMTVAAATPNGANVAVPFDLSGPWLWFTRERAVRVLYDARNDCYRRRTAEAALTIENTRDEAARRAALDETDASHVLAFRKSAAASRADAAPANWTNAASSDSLFLSARTASSLP